MKKLLFKLLIVMVLSFIHIFSLVSQDSCIDGPVKSGDAIYVDIDYPVATSTLQDDPEDHFKEKYSVHNAFDKNKKTAWVEGKKDAGIGEMVGFTVPLDSEYITIINGYSKSESLFKANNRVKEISLAFYTGVVTGFTECTVVFKSKLYKEINISLKDTLSEQEIAIGIDPVKFVKELKEFRETVYSDFPKYADYNQRDDVLICIITIKSVYPGTKYNDTCISEIGHK